MRKQYNNLCSSRVKKKYQTFLRLLMCVFYSFFFVIKLLYLKQHVMPIIYSLDLSPTNEIKHDVQ